MTADPELEGTHKDPQVQLLTPQRITQKPNPVSDSTALIFLATSRQNSDRGRNVLSSTALITARTFLYKNKSRSPGNALPSSSPRPAVGAAHSLGHSPWAPTTRHC